MSTLHDFAEDNRLLKAKLKPKRFKRFLNIKRLRSSKFKKLRVRRRAKLRKRKHKRLSVNQTPKAFVEDSVAYFINNNLYDVQANQPA